MLTHESKCTEAPILSNENGKDAEKSSEDDTDNLEDDTVVDDVDVLDDGTNNDGIDDGINDDGINDDGINAANILEEVTLPSTFHESI